MRECTKCGELKAKSEFYAAKERKDGLRPHCKKCCTIGHNAWYHRHGKTRQKTMDDIRKSNLKRRYGVSPARYQQMVKDQGGVCALCGATEPGRNHKNWCIDHCHNSAVVRGLLCHQCNVGLGAFKDNIGVLQKAIDYLETHSAKDFQ